MGKLEASGMGIENGPYLEELYRLYKENPNSIDPDWRIYFSNIDNTSSVSISPPIHGDSSLHYQVKDLVEAYRTYGHLMAHINPLAAASEKLPTQLRLVTYGLSERDLNQEVPSFGIVSEQKTSLKTLVETLRKVYCSRIGYEFIHVQNQELANWIQQQIESQNYQAELAIDERRKILQALNQSELFEVFLHTKYVGQKRFSLEGGESMIPVLNTVIESGALHGAEEFYIGMAHRGRLNVLTNVLNKSYAEVFSEFDEAYAPDSFEGSGDVKYHKGFVADIAVVNGRTAKVILAPNPSHLESVDPVIEGMVRSRQDQKKDASREKIVPILIHGDAALAGQGVVYETLQMYKLDGYTTGGTLHVVINNQIGFTTLPKDDRSTLYCTDLAKGFDSPIFHVNGEDPEACVRVAKLAAEIRQKFHCDVFIDIVCYRKYGHNEADEPGFTQPTTYEIIRKKRPVRDLYCEALIHEGLVEKEMAENLAAEFKQALQDEHNEIKEGTKNGNNRPAASLTETSLFHHTLTGVPEQIIKEISQAMLKIPEGRTLHQKIANLTRDRLKMGEGFLSVDWGMAELLAYASLLWQGINVRISGQDVCRGTFSHRHAMWVDQKTDERYFPLQHLKEKQGTFWIYNSLLSEFAVLGFEFGYSVVQPDALVVWEAQFGDFANGAQVIIDQYISASEQKWGQKANLVMLLPHGYEGQGPEHSSGRMERYLALTGNENIQVVNCTTPAQLFHLLRRQVLRSIRKPLVVFTPKGLLRHPECISSIEDLTKGSFMEILSDSKAPEHPKKIAFCTGRIYYDILAERQKIPDADVAFIRVEQLHPLDEERLKEAIGSYPKVEEFYWVQEEPQNMGAWEYIHRPLEKLLPDNKTLKYIGRPRSASTAAGSYVLHKSELKNIITGLFPPKQPSIFDMAGQHKPS